MRPTIKILSDADVEAIHQASLTILQRYGVSVGSAAARELLRKAGCSVADDRVHYPGQLVEEALSGIPKGFRVYGLDTSQVVDYSPGHTYFRPSGGLPFVLDYATRQRRTATFDDAALERYSAILRSLRARSIDPMLTLHHFSNPLWLARLGGWESRETVALFARFVRRTVEVLGQYCDLWCTVNEPNLYSYKGYVEGSFPPGETSLKRMRAVTRNLLAGHAAAYREIHDLQPKARVGLAHNMRILDPVDPQLGRDRRAARAADLAYNQAALTALTKGRWPRPVGFGLAWKLRGTLDWIGLNYCARDLVTSDGRQEDPVFKRRRHEEGAELLDGDRGEFYPRGMFRTIQRLSRLGLPIYITQNGIPDDDDDQRPRYMISHLHQMWRAIQLCYPVMGYYHRTLVDDFEWDDGWTLRFGLIQFDPRTRDRAPRPSAGLYSDIIRANAITPKIIDAYAPRLRSQLLPGRVVDR